MQQQALGKITDLAIANVHIALHLKEKQDGMVPMSTDDREAEVAPVQVPSLVSPNKIVGTAEEPSMEQIPAFGYPILRKTCGDAFDPLSLSDEIDKFIESLASEIIRLKDGGSGYFEVIDNAGHRISYLKVLRASSDKSFKNSKSRIDKCLNINGYVCMDQSSFQLCNYMCRKYHDGYCKALKKNGKEIAMDMGTVKYVAMLSELKISGMQERILARYLKEHLGNSFCPSQAAIGKLTEGHVNIQTGSKLWTYQGKDIEETVEWWEIDLDQAIAQRLERELVSRNTTPSDVVHVQAVVGGDHGDMAFQFGAAITVHLKSGDKVHFELLSCKLICRKDTSALIEATILRTLTKGLWIISEQPLHIYKSDGNTLVCKFDAPPPPEIDDPTKIKLRYIPLEI